VTAVTSAAIIVVTPAIYVVPIANLNAGVRFLSAIMNTPIIADPRSGRKSGTVLQVNLVWGLGFQTSGTNLDKIEDQEIHTK